jgi:peptide/nickel transport system permease protein
MASWLLRRLIQALIVMLAMTIIVFVGLHMIGDPIEVLVSPDANQQERQQVITALGLDQPLWRQYIAFLAGVVHGNLGTSFVYGRSAVDVILERMPATIELAVSAVILSVAVGIPLGLYAGLRPKAFLSRTLMAVSIFGFSLPSFWVALLFIMAFSVQLGWFPSSGRGETVSVLGVPWSLFTLDGLSHLALPAMNLALFQISLIMRLTRAGVQEVMQLEFIKFARAKGLSEVRIVGVHVLKNVMIPVVTVVGLEFGTLIAFAVVTESIFAWPGMGKLLIDSIYVLDRPMIVAYLIIVVSVFVLINLVVDILYTVLDPRVRISEEK